MCSGATGGGRRLIILIADDEPMVRIGLVNMLDELYPGEHLIIEAKNGRELVEAVKDYKPQIAFVDISMPLLDGLTAIKSIKEAPFQNVAGEGTKWVILTGAASFDYARASIKLGVCEYMLKPISLQELSDVVERVRKETGGAVQNESNDLIVKIKEYIKVNYAGDIGMDSISRLFGLTPNYLSKLFHERAGARFIDYLSQVRIDAAKRLLAENKYITVKQVSEMVGYFSARHFTKVFIKYSGGIYPSEYQKQTLYIDK